MLLEAVELHRGKSDTSERNQARRQLFYWIFHWTIANDIQSWTEDNCIL